MISRKLTVNATGLALATAMLAGTGATHPAHAQSGGVHQATLAEPDQKTREVSTEDVRRILVDDSAILLDTRTRAEYAAGHIPGAQNLDSSPAQAVAAVVQIVGGDKNGALVLYCNGPFCQASRRVSEQLLDAGFTNVKRFQLGIPVWRALGGPVAINVEGLLRIHGRDRTAVFFDARSATEFAAGSLPGAHSVPVDQLASGELKKAPLPEDDFNTRIVLFGRDGAQARALAEAMSTRPWHNVSYLAGSFETLKATIK